MLKVSNLPVTTSESDLEQLFSRYEKIHIDRIETTDNESIAYVKLENDEYEKDAIKKLDRSKWRGNYIYVDTYRGEAVGVDQPENKDTKNK